MLVLLKKFEIRFSVYAEPGSPEFELLSYLKDPSRTMYPLRDMAMIALTSVWLPLVYRDNSQLIPQHLHKVICDCTHRLEMQIQYFREMDSLAAQLAISPEAAESGGQLVKPLVQPEPSIPEEDFDPEEMFGN